MSNEQGLWNYAMQSHGINILMMVLTIISIITVAVSPFVSNIVSTLTWYGMLIIMMWTAYFLFAANSYDGKRRKEKYEKLQKLAKDLFGDKGEDFIEFLQEVQL